MGVLVHFYGWRLIQSDNTERNVKDCNEGNWDAGPFHDFDHAQIFVDGLTKGGAAAAVIVAAECDCSEDDRAKQ